ncbi:hypothetical protein DAETH_19080 [Deinococcus aetherius]|uniref:Uncharacterized protein n=1 Tax=Deinococcus aetherius TaxID=200252 RepID=A0ABM8ADT0_9DEIO|nr:hypothetical protein [Deinococcus aetherius]BDP41939.1 hypothetical protein DAETH_19080 [Deinococcus aetherius]
MTALNLPQPLAIELDEATWNEFLDRSERWFGQVRAAQASFRKLAEDVLGQMHEPHLRQLIKEVVVTARRHEEQVDELYRVIGREPPSPSLLSVGGQLLSKGQEALGALQGLATGAQGWWDDLHQLFLSSLNSISAFSAAEQLGYALGIREIVDIAFPISLEKFKQHRMIQEILNELVPLAILYRTGV